MLLLFGLVPMFLAMPFQTLLVVFATEVWHEGPNGLGILSALAGTGGVVGSVILAWQGPSNRRLRQMMMSVLLFGSFLLLFSLSPYFLLALPMVFIANIFGSIFSTLNNTAIQLIIPDHVRGRISSFLMMSFSLPLLGTLPMSAVAEVYGAPLAVGASSILAMGVAVIFYAMSPALRNLDRGVRQALEEERDHHHLASVRVREYRDRANGGRRARLERGRQPLHRRGRRPCGPLTRRGSAA